jgi:hypothetical protein
LCRLHFDANVDLSPAYRTAHSLRTHPLLIPADHLSVLELAKAHARGETTIPGLPQKLKVSERKLVMADLVNAEKDKTLLEVFGTGTAAIISPVDK